MENKRPSSDGTSPVNKLLWRKSSSRLVSEPRSDGIGPLRELKPRSSSAKREELPIAEGMVPVNLLLLRSRREVFKAFSLKNSTGLAIALLDILFC